MMHSKVTSLHVTATVPCVISVGVQQEKAQKATVQRPFVALEQACLLQSRLVYVGAALEPILCALPVPVTWDVDREKVEDRHNSIAF